MSLKPTAMNTKIKFILLYLFIVAYAGAQELNCNIQINSDQISGSNKSVFNTLQKSVSDFVNNRRWTEMSYSNAEKIECSMNIIVKSVEQDVFNAEIQVFNQMGKSVYQSSGSIKQARIDLTNAPKGI